MKNSNVIIVTECSFKEKVLKNENYVLVDFWADWCHPCKILSPILEEISLEYKEKLVVASVNVEKNPDISDKYSIRGIPTLLLFKNGELKASKVGSISKDDLKNFIDTNLQSH